MVSFLLKNIKDVLTTIFVYTVVVLATTTKKSPPTSIQHEDCIIPSCATIEAVHLDTSTLSDPNSLCVQLTFTSVSNSIITVLVDSGSTHCFVDSRFAHTHNLLLTSIPPIHLRLFNGTSHGTITQSFQFPVIGMKLCYMGTQNFILLSIQ